MYKFKHFSYFSFSCSGLSTENEICVIGTNRVTWDLLLEQDGRALSDVRTPDKEIYLGNYYL